MNKKMILPLAGLVLLIGAVLLAVYFKSMEKDIERQRKEAWNKTLNLQENDLKTDNADNQESENNQITGESKKDEGGVANAEEAIGAEEIDIMEKDLDDLENLMNDSILESLDSDLGSF